MTEASTLNADATLLWKLETSFANSPVGRECFLKGCKWSPDGNCLLTISEDAIVRLFELPKDGLINDNYDNPVLSYKEGGLIYDFQWYPSMNSNDPVSCVFASSSQSSPVHLWDAYTGSLRATYQPINQYDEVAPAYSICFSPLGKLYCGLKKQLQIFDISIPGRDSEKRSLKSADDYIHQKGIVSAIAVNPGLPSLYALGCYDKTIGLYTEPEGELQCVLQAQQGGVTHIIFSKDGTKMYSGGRKDPEILCWDLRNPGTLLFTIKRVVKTFQRIYFDLSPDDRFLFTGSTDGFIDVYDTEATVSSDGILPSILKFSAHNDCANGVSINTQNNLLATSSGQRHFSLKCMSDSENSDDDDDLCITENSVKIWRMSVLSKVSSNDVCVDPVDTLLTEPS